MIDWIAPSLGNPVVYSFVSVADKTGVCEVEGVGDGMGVGEGAEVGNGVGAARRDGDRSCGTSVPSGLVQARESKRTSRAANRTPPSCEVGNRSMAIFNREMQPGETRQVAPGISPSVS